MTMSQMLTGFILIPLLGYLMSLLIPKNKEAVLSGWVLTVIGLQLLAMFIFIVKWLTVGSPTLEIKTLVLYHSKDFEFFIDYYFDHITAVFALTGAFLTFIVALFSKYYMHRDAGFKRFFSTMLLFYTGYNLIVFSGNFETLFVGWEMIGITSFLLISFYRDRYLPAKNGFKVLSFYRLGDICLILAMWLSHHLWHKNITFSLWNQTEMVMTQFNDHYAQSFLLVVLIFLAAAIKSAQFPFSTWLPRAMEGPTTSSAIFYGSLSVHIGVFLLLRTFPFWGHEAILKGIVISIGVVTSLVAGSIAMVQSSVKTKIAYASITQIGLMFVEIALGWHLLALFHFAGNALLRTYQLLVSPSVLSYLVHNMFFAFTPAVDRSEHALIRQWKNRIFVLSVKEWNLDFMLFRYLWRPFKWIGSHFNTLHTKWSIILYIVLSLLSLIAYSFRFDIAAHWSEIAPVFMAVVALVLLVSGFAGRGDARQVWIMVFVSQLFIALALIWNSHIEMHRVALYLSGTIAGAGLGFWCLTKLVEKEGDINLHEYHGHSYEHPVYTGMFLIACLAVVGFPLSPTFVGVDLMFMSIASDQFVMIGLLALNFLLLELTLLRIYVRVFLGQHKKNYHPIAFKSS